MRAIAEAAPGAASIALYAATGAAASALVGELLAAAGVTADADARARLDRAAEQGRDTAAGEIAKAAILASPGTHLSAAHIAAVSLDSAEAARDEVALAACSGNAVVLDRLLADAEADAESATSLLRAVSGLLGRIGALRAAVDGEVSPRDAVRSSRPPIHFGAQDLWAGMISG